MACSNYWSSPFQVGSHHLANGFLAAGCEVAFFSDPISPFHRFAGGSESLKERVAINRIGGISEETGKLWAYVPNAWLTPHNKPILNSKFVAKNWISLTSPSLRNILENRGFDKVDLLYIDSPCYLGLLDIVEAKRSVLRVADNCLGFNKFTPAMRINEIKIASCVDVTLYTARNLLPVIQELKPKSARYFPNGVNFDHFHKGNQYKPREYEGINKPIILYVGAMDVWFDYDMVNKLVSAMPDCMFIMIGPAEMAVKKLVPKDNLKLLGKKTYSELPAYMHHAGVGIIPFAFKSYPDLVKSINPLKLYEYMSCGLPVVSSRWPEMEEIGGSAVLADDFNQFLSGIRVSLVQRDDRASRVAWARSFDWSERVKELLSL